MDIIVEPAQNEYASVVYSNPVNALQSYVYPTELECSLTMPQERLISTDGTKTNVIKISVMGVPDGISPYINETLMTGSRRSAVFIFIQNNL